MAYSPMIKKSHAASAFVESARITRKAQSAARWVSTAVAKPSRASIPQTGIPQQAGARQKRSKGVWILDGALLSNNELGCQMRQQGEL
jgi:hypothetical protein